MVKLVVGSLLVGIFLGVGVACTFYPRSLQKLLIRGRGTAFGEPVMDVKFLRKYTESDVYVWHLRLCGIVGLAGGGVKGNRLTPRWSLFSWGRASGPPQLKAGEASEQGSAESRRSKTLRLSLRHGSLP